MRADGTTFAHEHAEVEIEYLNHEPQIAEKRFDPEGKVTAPQDSFKTMSIRADAMGQIIIGFSQEPTNFHPLMLAIEVDQGVHWNLFSP